MSTFILDAMKTKAAELGFVPEVAHKMARRYWSREVFFSYPELYDAATSAVFKLQRQLAEAKESEHALRVRVRMLEAEVRETRRLAKAGNVVALRTGARLADNVHPLPKGAA